MWTHFFQAATAVCNLWCEVCLEHGNASRLVCKLMRVCQAVAHLCIAAVLSHLLSATMVR